MSENWVATTDPNSGRVYYANLKTGESQWTEPSGFTGKMVEQRPGSADPANGTDNNSSDGSSDEQPIAEQYGQQQPQQHNGYDTNGAPWGYYEDAYYTDHHYPDQMATNPMHAAAAARASNWSNGVEAAGGGGGPPENPVARLGRTSVESDHRTSNGHNPYQQQQQPPQQAVAQPSPVQPAAQPDTPWRSRVDPNSGRTYYYHIETRETSWVKPDELRDAEEQTISLDDTAYQTMVTIPNATRYGDTTVNPHNVNLAPDSDEDLDSDDELDLKFSRPAAPEEKRQFGNIKYQAVDTTKEKHVVTAEEYENQVEQIMEELLVEEEKEDEYFESLAITQGDRFRLEKYATTYFAKSKKGKFSGSQTIDEMLSHTSKMLKQSLKKLPSRMSTEAVQAFKNILSFMGERKSSKKDPIAHAQKLLKQCINSPEELRDEVYVQLCKQTTKNPNPTSLLQAWKLIALTVGTFPPSEEFACYLSAYFHDRSSEPGEVGAFAKYALRRLDKTMVEGSRVNCPTSMEVEAIQQRKPVAIRVEFLDGSHRSLLVDSQTLVKQVAAMLVKGMDIENEKSFALSEMEDEPPDDPERDKERIAELERRKADKSPGADKTPIEFLIDRVLEKDDRVLDVFGKWDLINVQLPKERRKNFKLVFKIRLFHRDEEEKAQSDQARRLYFVQAAHDVVQGYYPLQEKNALDLAALQVQANYGVNEHSFYKTGIIRDKIFNYVPKKFRATRDHGYLEMMILQEHEKYIGLSKAEAQIKYLAIVKKYQSYGCTFFSALRISRVRRSTDPGEDLIVGISERGVVMLDPITRALLHEWELSEILSYGFKDKMFLLVTGNLMQQKKWFLRAVNGREMHDLLRIYIARLVALQE